MGIFNFVKEAGEEAAELASERSMAEALTTRVSEYGFQVDDLQIEFDDGIATVHGSVDDAVMREEVILMIGNVQGVGHVDDRIQVRAPDVPEPVFYTVAKGDSLWKIAKAHYGDGSKYKVIVEANKAVLKGTETIHPGYVLRIPGDRSVVI